MSYLGIGSRANITWTCTEGHNFEKQVRDFSKPTGTSCPKCRELGIKQKYNNQKYATSTLGQLLSCEFLMTEFSKNNTIKPETIALGNNRTKILWTCPLCSEDYKSSASQRHRKQTGCPTCNNKRTQSRNEIRIFCELKKLFNSVKENYIVEGYKYDVYIQDLNLLIEYDGLKWHSYEKAKINDIKKNNIAKTKNYKLIRLREYGLEKTRPNDIIIHMDTNINRGEKVQFHIIKLLLNYIEKSFCLNFNNYKDSFLKLNKFINNKLYNEKLSEGFVENNLTKHPRLNEYNINKTGINPKAISLNSGMKVWWKCNKGEDHSWQEQVRNRNNPNCGCPFCSNKRISITNRLDLKYPIVNQIWSIKNIKQSEDYTYRNGKNKIIWDCINCKEEFEKKISTMVDGNGFCPHCRHRNLKQ